MQRDLHSSLSSNATLAEQYSRLQGDYLAEKTRMLELLDRQELMKTDIRDSKQVSKICYLIYRVKVKFGYTDRIRFGKIYSLGWKKNILHNFVKCLA